MISPKNKNNNKWFLKGAVNILSLNDSIIVGTGFDAKGEFFIYNTSSEFFEWRPFLLSKDIVFNDKLIESGLQREYKQGIIKIKPDQSHFVKSFNYLPNIDVYDQHAELSFSIVYNNYKKLKINSKINQFEPETQAFYANVFLSDNYIYALNLNCNLLDMKNNKCKDVEIHVFDWDGNPICKYKLNEGIVLSGAFVVDENNRKIYTINPKVDDDYYSQFSIGSELIME